jgi:predicted nucleic acid-binding protein
MTDFVLDNSVAMRWILSSEKLPDQSYAESVLATMKEDNAHVPNLWHLEAANVLLSSNRRGDLEIAEIERFIAQLENLPIYVDPLTASQVFGRVMTLAGAYRLSSYDAAYLELAIREGIPLATLDKNLLKAAKKAEVEIYLKP